MWRGRSCVDKWWVWGYKAGVNQLQIDPATGFLQSYSPGFATFDAAKKTKFIELAQECLDRKESPKLSAICKAVGISMGSFWNHVEQDAEFKRQWDEIRFQLEDILSQSLVNLGQKANGVGAAAFWLKNRVPERWSDNPGSNQNFQDFSWIKKLADAFNGPKTVVEAEIVPDNKSIDNQSV